MRISESIQKLQKLNEKDGVKVSLYIPTHPKTDTNTYEQDRINLKNALQDAKNRLGGKNTLKKELAQLETTFMSGEFIKHQSLTTAAFVSESSVVTIRIPMEVEYAVSVSDSFVLEPLMMVENLTLETYLVDVNSNKPRLFFGDLESVKEVDLDIKSFKELLALDHEQNQQFHAGVRSGEGVMYHGHGARSDQKGSDVDFYYGYIADELHQKLGHTQQLVMLAGEQRATAMLRHKLKLPNVVEVETGNIEHVNEAEIRDVISDELQKRTLMTVDGLRGNLPVVNSLKNSYQLIKEGRAAKVFVPAIRKTTDSVRSGVEKRLVLTIPKSKETLEAIREATRHGGHVFAVQQSDVDELAIAKRY